MGGCSWKGGEDILNQPASKVCSGLLLGLLLCLPPSSKAAVQTSAGATFLQAVIPSPNSKTFLS